MNQECIKGTIANIIYNNPDNHYTVMDIDMSGILIPATGCIMHVSEGAYITAYGEWYNHPNYGEQFKISEFSIETPKDIESIRHYLSSGLLSGIGQKKADDLIKKFGTRIFEVIETSPEQLTEVKGIGKKTAESIHESYMTQIIEREIVMDLLQYGISANISMKLYRQYGGNTVSVIQDDPYRLIDEFGGIGFLRADAIAMSTGIAVISSKRIQAGLRYCMSLASQKGHCFLPENLLIQETSKILKVDPDLTESELIRIYDNEEIILDERSEQRRCYQPAMHEYEEYCAEKLKQIYNDPTQREITDTNKLLDRYQTFTGIALHAIQRDAVRTAVSEKVTIITGGPGTGKTTIIKAIIYILQLQGQDFALAAPTGRAAKRMSEACGYEAKTIHRMLEYTYAPTNAAQERTSERFQFNRNEDQPLEQKFIIIDEMSMVDLPLMFHLLNALEDTTSLILVGDADQLPSVGPGNVLSDLIQSKQLPFVKLQQVFRRSNESTINLNAHKINEGTMPDFDNPDEFVMIEAVTQQKIATRIIQMFRKDSIRAKELIDQDKLQILSPFKNGEAGVINLNRKLQEILNPPSGNDVEVQIPQYKIRIGDKVMQTKNNYTITWKNLRTHELGEGIFNGDTGYIEQIDPLNKEIYVVFDNERVVTYGFDEASALTLAYTITIHKSQGSEFDTVLIPIYSGNPEFLTRNLIYTAVTRAKEKVILVGEQRTLRSMIHNNRLQNRYSALQERLCDE